MRHHRSGAHQRQTASSGQRERAGANAPKVWFVPASLARTPDGRTAMRGCHGLGRRDLRRGVRQGPGRLGRAGPRGDRARQRAGGEAVRLRTWRADRRAVRGPHGGRRVRRRRAAQGAGRGRSRDATPRHRSPPHVAPQGRVGVRVGRQPERDPGREGPGARPHLGPRRQRPHPDRGRGAAPGPRRAARAGPPPREPGPAGRWDRPRLQQPARRDPQLHDAARPAGPGSGGRRRHR